MNIIVPRKKILTSKCLCLRCKCRNAYDWLSVRPFVYFIIVFVFSCNDTHIISPPIEFAKAESWLSMFFLSSRENLP